jgi:hypothetical protein
MTASRDGRFDKLCDIMRGLYVNQGGLVAGPQPSGLC